MAYNRFLTDKDYISLATDEHMRQLIREQPERIPQAEQRAEMNMLEYLDQYYEIERLLAVGKNIREYNAAVSYPANVWIKRDEEIFKTLTHINGIKKPTKAEYWRQVVDFVGPRLMDKAVKYSQLRTYSKGDIVKFGTEYWECRTPHGYDAGEIHMPGVSAWKEAEVTPWEPNLAWEKDQVCSYNGEFYQYLGKSEAESLNDNDNNNPADTPADDIDEADGSQQEPKADAEVLTPEEDDDWGLIGEYSDTLEYNFEEGAFDYVVAEGMVFYPVLNPNVDTLAEGVNITRDDPRNANVVAHMSRIALYYLHQIISPTNISETRRWAYEDSMTWLYNASKFKINPQLPRKREKDSCNPKVDWALETFQRDYNPNENPWLI